MQKKSIWRAAALCGESTTLTPQMAHKYVTEFYKMRSMMSPLDTEEHDSIHVFAAQIGIAQYYLSGPFLDYLAQSDESRWRLERYHERYNITAQVLHSWGCARVEFEPLGMGHEGDTRTLSHLLTYIMSPDDATYGHHLWFAALEACERMKIGGKSIYSIVPILVIFFRASRNPALLRQQALEYRQQERISFDLETFLQWRVERSHPHINEEDIKLFEELKRLAAPHNPTENTGKKQPKPKKRKNEGHQSRNKRRR
jgi:hypothetical protein